jgi:predicted RNase H-like HicB family nuclease
MACTLNLSVRLQVLVEIHEIEGGGYWGRVPRFPGCVAQAETIEALKANVVDAVDDWLNEKGWPVSVTTVTGAAGR